MADDRIAFYPPDPDAVEFIKAALALPGVHQEVLEQEAAELCDGLDKWLAAVAEEEKANG